VLLSRIAHNGPVVWLGAVCVGVGEFFAIPIAIGTWYFSQETVTVQALPAGRQAGKQKP